ncbi:hypothetical protein K491DRAFT_758255 [Lophiostoma macrostomum CBS 122681]|uniref:Lytic polysaccharide monooxygenase n=1 Tax=Lophiostoma macrostomum CBS 122681 TaxID=1314788 RepID=A0A6A6TA41_9PLEO|nr:hypothetical protein K491DRAFT_758255 [Lophiostoma macrostomum CBS 122681]
MIPYTFLYTFILVHLIVSYPTMSIAGSLTNRRSFVCGPNGRIKIPVTCRGAGMYTLKLNHPISAPTNIVAYRGGTERYISGTQGQPYTNCFAWVVPNSTWTGAQFNIEMTAGMPGASVVVELWTAAPGTTMPPAYGSSGSCVVM